MRTKNPKAFWDYINSLDSSKTIHDDLKLNDFYAIFKELNFSIDDVEKPEAENVPTIHVHMPNNLNDDITEEKIANSIKQLKIGKAFGQTLLQMNI